MILFRILIAILLLTLIRISTTDEQSLRAMENAYNNEMQQKFEQSYRDTLRACNIDPND